MRAVDTAVIVRLAVRDDTAQVAAAEAFILQGGRTDHWPRDRYLELAPKY